MAPTREPLPKFWCRTCQEVTASRVLSTRGVRRRRECRECGGTFATLEAPVDDEPPPPRHRPDGQGQLPIDAEFVDERER